MGIILLISNAIIEDYRIQRMFPVTLNKKTTQTKKIEFMKAKLKHIEDK